MRAVLVTGAGALIETARRGIKRAIARKRRERNINQGKSVLKKVGIVAAVAGATYGTVAAFRAARDR